MAELWQFKKISQIAEIFRKSSAICDFLTSQITDVCWKRPLYAILWGGVVTGWGYINYYYRLCITDILFRCLRGLISRGRVRHYPCAGWKGLFAVVEWLFLLGARLGSSTALRGFCACNCAVSDWGSLWYWYFDKATQGGGMNDLVTNVLQ